MVWAERGFLMVGGEVARVKESTARAEAFRRLAERHLDESYRLARAIVGPADAEDATHDAFVAAWRSWSTLRDPSLFEHWFHRILVNTCRNRLRSSRRRQVRDISADFAVGGEDEVGRALDRDVVEAALGRLGPDDRIVIALRYYRDLTIDQIAGQLGIRSGTVKSRLHNAMHRLQLIFDEADAKGKPQ